MRYQPVRATMSRPHAHAVWDAPDRESAMAAAVESHGLDGSKILEAAEGPPLAPSDLAMITGHPWGGHWLAAVPAMFAQGLAGYTDDRLADGPGWVTFDVADITSPVVVLHGARDVICDLIHALVGLSRSTEALVEAISMVLPMPGGASGSYVRSMSEHPNVTVINRMTAAVFENDRDTLADVFTEDVELHVRGPLPRPGDHRGVDGFLGALGAIFELTGGDVKIEQLFCTAEGPWAAEWEHCVLGRNGTTLEAKNAFIYRFSGGRIAEMWMICTAPGGSESFWE